MGFSYRVDASRVLDAIGKFHDKAHGTPTQYLLTDAKGAIVGFYEISRRDQPDGGICGTVHKFVNAERTLCLPAGSFKIDGDGNVVRFPMARIKDMKKAGVIRGT